jgi:hypothetical protein
MIKVGSCVRTGNAVMNRERNRPRSDTNSPFDNLLGGKDSLGVQEAGEDSVRLNLCNCCVSPIK